MHGIGVVALIAAGSAILAAPAAASALGPALDGVRWGETARELERHLGKSAVEVAPPIEFGDAYVAVAVPHATLGRFPFTIYYQMDKATHRLKRVMLERQRHGANTAVFSDVVATLTTDYGQPSRSCSVGARPRNGYQAVTVRLWHRSDIDVRAVFRDTTLEAAEGCITIRPLPCGLTGHLYVEITPSGAPAPGCG